MSPDARDGEASRRWVLAAGVAAAASTGCLRLQSSDGGSDGTVSPGPATGTTAGSDAPPTAGTTTSGTLEVSADWPQFQRDATNAGAALDVEGPADSPSVQWTSAEAAGMAWAQPVVADGRVYVATHTESDNSAVHAFEAGDGSLAWYRDLPGWSEFTPAYGEGTLFVGTGGEGELRAIDAATGEVRWFLSMGDTTLAAPTYRDGTVYVGTADGVVAAHAADDGAERWRADLGGVVPAPPTVTDRGVHVTTTAPAASFEEPADVFRTFVYYDEEQVQRVADAGGTSTVHALSPADGSVRSTRDLPAIVSESPTVVDGSAYLGTWHGILARFDAGDLAKEWTANAGGLLSTTPTVDAQRVYVGRYDGEVAAYARDDGSEAWTSPVQEGQHAAPVRIGDLLYVPTRGNRLLAVLPDSGAARWEWEAPAGDLNVAVVDGAAFVTTGDTGPVYALAPD